MWIPSDLSRALRGMPPLATTTVQAIAPATTSIGTSAIEPWDPGAEFWRQIRDVVGDVWDLIDWSEIIEAMGEYVWPSGEYGVAAPAGQKVYNGVYVEGGVIKVPIIDRHGQPRNLPLGLTYKAAQKKYRVTRRRKRLTKRDMYILEALKSSGKMDAAVAMQMI